MQSSFFLLALLAGVAYAVPEPARTLTVSTARAGATMGAAYYVLGASAPIVAPPPAKTAPAPRPPQPVVGP